MLNLPNISSNVNIIRWFNHCKFLLLLTIFFVFQTIFSASSKNDKSELSIDTLGGYVKNELDQASIAKNKDWSEAITITGNLLDHPLVRQNDSLINFVKYRHSLYLLMIDENIQSQKMINEIIVYYKENNPKRWTNLKSRLGSLAIRLGDYDLAKTHLEEALPFAQRLDMPITEGLIYLSLSNICRLKSDFGDAYRKADIALQKFRKIDRKDWILEAQTTMAFVCVLAKDYDGATALFDEIFDGEEDVLNDNFLVSPTLYSGIMNFEKGDIPLAKQQLEKGLTKINSLGNFPDLTMVYIYMSHISSIEKDFVAAEDYILKALSTTKKSYNKRQTLNARLTLIKLETIIRPKKDNLSKLENIYEWALKNEDNILLKKSSNLISSYYSDKGDFKKAIEYNKIYIKATEEKFQKDHLNEIALIKEKSKYLQEVNEREVEAQKFQLQLTASETRKNMMFLGILFLVLMSAILLYFYFQKQQAYSSLKVSNQEIKKAELSLELKNKELEKYIAYNLQLENFAFIASHDLKSPLQTISNFSRLLKKSAKSRLQEEELQYLTFISKGTEDMAFLVDDILDFSILQKSELIREKINVSEFVDYVLQLNQSLIKERNAEISLNLQTPYISGDRSKLLQLLQNLITNSVKFQQQNKQPKIVISSYDEPENWVFNVEDNGIGIESSYFNKIFLIFKRLHGKEEYAGNGIGLSKCKKIVEMHGGKIWVNSSFGQGSTFSFSIPK